MPATVITHAEQRYVDEPVYVEVARATKVALAVNRIFPGNRRIEPKIEEFSHFQRVPLRWMRPDGLGGLVPK